MTTQEYFKIGSEVDYLRHDTELKVYEETGIVRAIFLDPSNRLMVQVKSGDNAWNVHYKTINHTHNIHMVKQYKDLLQDIRGTSDEGDKVVEEIVSKYNTVVEQLTTDLLGDPLALEVEEDDEAAS